MRSRTKTDTGGGRAAGSIAAKHVDLNRASIVFERYARVAFELDGRTHTGVVCGVNHHDFFGNEWSYDIIDEDEPMMFKNMTVERDRILPLDGRDGPDRQAAQQVIDRYRRS
ncbi:hypothetical protein [Bifidobacterium sp. SO4]|uniref:hypothetical protein n=1 Tax=Bifidobacterium sp. SO4 TaxID=2809030 RepID=UPI001BDC1C37|nr:hypothetical protein [Bifidobacterium sp. SO4]MBT1171209.1 hypothetical protein [Bifidobacterium sp. SO4]